ncbi:hypothetical protein OHB39_36580 [Streptomyces sp. NBC_00047]|uniref:hypothetical protein n=1 Tax=Streptomyces sp. NBC_00047 TaxID=2975627 RepID=UPI00225688AE|nr:hypothetical protein [Streptomyces sp. NBC_00047]MCX5613027.1 hypothetical protein [Streptomyces sp. NBC_00047]
MVAVAQFRRPQGATAPRWVDGLTVADATVPAEYDHLHFGRWPALTIRRSGAGRIACVGTVPGATFARAWGVRVSVAGRRRRRSSISRHRCPSVEAVVVVGLLSERRQVNYLYSQGT